MAFSGALTLTDLNDFITPSQACIKTVEQTNSEFTVKEAGAASTEIRIDSAGSYYEVSLEESTTSNGVNGVSTPSAGRKLEQAQISLNDCLACSGCITSAESMLITLQSHVEVLNMLDANAKLDPLSPSYRIPVISIAPQSLASLAASLSATPSSSQDPVTARQILHRVRVFCQQILGFSHVFDTTFARHLCLKEHVREFEERRSKSRAGEPESDGQLPMLASACPGWICYAEKTHSEMLPFISRTKSPQQTMGTLVKYWMGEKWGKLPHEVYHVTVMPCYDKKLEASRQDFYNDLYSTRDVDCVITTGELEVMMHEKGWDINQPVAGESNSSSATEFGIPNLLTHPGSSSGSYLQTIVDHLIATSPVPLILSKQLMRNSDYEEYILRDSTCGTIVFKGAKCYGFRNLQNVVRKVGKDKGLRMGAGAAGRLGRKTGAKRGVVARRTRDTDGANEAKVDEKEKAYDYVEVMACPGGCVNGGGQLKPPAMLLVGNDAEGYPREWMDSGVARVEGAGGVPSAPRWGDREWTRKMEEAYWRDGSSGDRVPEPNKRDTMSSSTGGQNDCCEEADRLARRVLWDLCYRRHRHGTSTPISGFRTVDAIQEGQSCDDDSDRMRLIGDGMDGNEIDGCDINSDADMRWRQLFRTQYRAVESEVVGLAVKW